MQRRHIVVNSADHIGKEASQAIHRNAAEYQREKSVISRDVGCKTDKQQKTEDAVSGTWRCPSPQAIINHNKINGLNIAWGAKAAVETASDFQASAARDRDLFCLRRGNELATACDRRAARSKQN